METRKGIGNQIDRVKRQENADKIIKVITENNMTYGETMAVLKYLYDCFSNQGKNFLDDVHTKEILNENRCRYYT